MHIPDGLMDPSVLLVGWIISIVFITIAVRMVNRNIDRKAIPVMALLAAGLFVAQMLNFPIGGGTSGHLLGAVLAGYLLGPWAGMLVMLSVIIIQAFLFGDGGITALGVNILNMAVVGTLLGGYLPRLFNEKYRFIAIATLAWFSVFAGSLLCASELSISYLISDSAYGITPSIALPAMSIFHALIGIGEAVISIGVVVYIEKVAPEVLDSLDHLVKRKVST